VPTVINVAKPSSAMGSVKNHETASKVERAALLQPLSSAPDPPRVQVAEAPENGFRYPIPPDANLTGKVDLKAIIGSDGTVKGVDVLSGNRLLAAAAVRAVQHWRYRPPQVDGHPVEAESKIVISFLGDEAVSVRFPPNQ
jgi:TonB family protein